MEDPNGSPSKRAFLSAYRFFFCAGGVLIGCGIVSRFKFDFGFGPARATVEHVIGGAGAMIVLFGLLCAHDYVPGKRKPGLRYCRNVAWRTVAAAMTAHFGWESGQAYCPYVAALYDMAPRGYIQWEQLGADLLGTLLGLAVVHGFIRSKANPLRAGASSP